jgi:hypothetical protein
VKDHRTKPFYCVPGFFVSASVCLLDSSEPKEFRYDALYTKKMMQRTTKIEMNRFVLDVGALFLMLITTVRRQTKIQT